MFVKANRPINRLLLSSLLFGMSVLPVAADDDLEVRLDCAFADEEAPRRRPGKPVVERLQCEGDGLQPAVWRPLPEFAAIPDRWRIVTALG